MKGRRRLYGWLEEWPDQADKGHFVIEEPEWVLADGSRIPIPQTHCFLIAVSEVKRVEFLSSIDEASMTTAELKDAQEPLIALHRSQEDGRQATESTPKPTEQPAEGLG